jgi:hypothetical protein
MTLKVEQIDAAAANLEATEPGQNGVVVGGGGGSGGGERVLLRTRSLSFGTGLSDRQKQKNFEVFVRNVTSGTSKSFIKK